MYLKHRFPVLVAMALLVLWSLMAPCDGTSSGAPSQACLTLTPQHGSSTAQPPVHPYPYQIQLGTNLYQAGNTITVSVTGPRTDEGFKGFILQARFLGQSVPVGSWEGLPTSAARTLSCRGLDDTVTHSDTSLKDVIAFRWKAPASNVGPLQFVATVVESYTSFWGPFYSDIVQVGDVCTSNPCLHGGSCTSFDSYFLCTCLHGYTGERCETQWGQVCYPTFCLNGGTCIVLDTNEFMCICRYGMDGNRCQNVFRDVCTSNPCYNGGACTPLGDVYQCSCRPGFSGTQCQNNACSLNPCRNGGACLLNGHAYQCMCPIDYTGSQCETRVLNGCSPSPCLNGGICLSSHGTVYHCNCPVGFTGTRCQDSNSCLSNPCLNSGTCTSYESAYECTCLPGYSGTRCQNVVVVCLPNPCLNGGQCSELPGNSAYQCSCLTGYSGSRCQNDACSNSPCVNGSICSVVSGTANYQCTCSQGYTGTNCQNSCSPNPCLNGGSCSSSPTENTFQCYCSGPWAGPICNMTSQAVCDRVSICVNGGTCQPNIGGSFICVCPEGYDGVDCSNQISPCLPNPCLNGGSCVEQSSTSFTCTCPPSHLGVICDIEDLCHPSPCHQGICQQPSNSHSYNCSCYEGYTGTYCDIQALCNPNPCVNGACEQDDVTLTYFCQCNPGFIGEICDQVREEACVTNPCLNGSSCVVQTDDKYSYECACLAGYQGTFCDEAVIPVFQDCPEFEILTFALQPGQNSADVSLATTATVPGLEVTMETITGPDIPGLVPFSEEFRAGSPVTLLATSPATGAIAECSFLLKLTDEEPPTVNCPANITKVTYGSSEEVSWSPASASDNLAMPADLTITYSMENGSSFTAYEDATATGIDVTTRDTFGNVGECQFQVTVVKIPNPPTPIFLGCREGEMVSYQLRDNTDVAYISIDLQARDSNQQPAIITQVEGPVISLPGDVTFSEPYREGQKFMFQALDPHTELTSICTFWIKLVDKEPPQITCPANIVERTTTETKALFWSPVSIQDNLVLPMEDSVTSDPQNGSLFDATANGLSHIVTMTATDSFGNADSCDFSVMLYRFDVVCSEFPTVANGSSECVIAGDGKKECHVSCDPGYAYAAEDDRFKCQITDTKAFWEPMPGTLACMRPVVGIAISKTVTAVFPFHLDVCDASSRAFVLAIQTSVQSGLEEATLCLRGAARACEPDSITPRCGVVAGGDNPARRRRAFTDLTVDIRVAATLDDAQGSSLTQIRQDVDDLTQAIQEHTDQGGLVLLVDHEEVESLTSETSEDYTWMCQDGYKSVADGCVPCPSGTYFNTSSLQCMFCELGSYQFLSGQISCRKCPLDRATDQTGSVGIRQCLALETPLPLTWSPFMISMVIVVIALVIVFLLGIFCIACCVPKKEERYGQGADADGSLSNLKYLNKAYEEEYTKRRSVGIHQLGKRQTSPSRASTATGYITMSTAGSSSINNRNHVDMVSIDSEDYHHDAHGKAGHFNHGNTIARDSGIAYGRATTATLTKSGDGFNSPTQQRSGSGRQRRAELIDTGL